MLDSFLLGARHGVDADHLVAISELTAGERGGLGGFVAGVRYALGHAATVLALGLVAGTMGFETPDRVIGATLVGLGAWAAVRLSKGTALEHEHLHEHGGAPDAPHAHDHEVEAPTAPHRHRHRHEVAVGMVHGLGGAPGAVLVGGRGGVALLVFTGGLLLSNGVVGAVAGATAQLTVVAWTGVVLGTAYGTLLLFGGG